MFTAHSTTIPHRRQELRGPRRRISVHGEFHPAENYGQFTFTYPAGVPRAVSYGVERVLDCCNPDETFIVTRLAGRSRGHHVFLGADGFGCDCKAFAYDGYCEHTIAILHLRQRGEL